MIDRQEARSDVARIDPAADRWQKQHMSKIDEIEILAASCRFFGKLYVGAVCSFKNLTYIDLQRFESGTRRDDRR
jgi:competence transcription factor ComK